ncbi:MAG: hypothetical protein A2029_01525 [Chloroflexi bacterium RBG_19FT_COMBO_47_9]|nr:MAG: hypothetical protein A2029_01525 [Chloroflexi bacterium RBG_19FT_COMBO_47_9]
MITVTDDRTFRRPTTLTMTDDIDDNAVDDTKVGNRVAQFYRRQGGNATNWDTPGSTDYTPTAVRKQLGVRTLEILSGNYSASVAITFPVAFSVVPAVKIGIQGIAGTVDGRSFFGHASGLTAAGFTLIAARSTNPASQNDVTLVWEATGTE